MSPQYYEGLEIIRNKIKKKREIEETLEKTYRVLKNLKNRAIEKDSKEFKFIYNLDDDLCPYLRIDILKNYFENYDTIKKVRIKVLEIFDIILSNHEFFHIIDGRNIQISISSLLSSKNKEIKNRAYEVYNRHLKEKTEDHKVEKSKLKITDKESKNIFNVFFSYSTEDSKYYRISEIANLLKKYPGINKVSYWERDSGSNVIKYMEDGLTSCNIFLLFCSEKTTNSAAVEGEWQAAYQLSVAGSIKIIPIYNDNGYIPNLLLSLLNVKYNRENLEEFMQELYKEIVR